MALQPNTANAALWWRRVVPWRGDAQWLPFALLPRAEGALLGANRVTQPSRVRGTRRQAPLRFVGTSWNGTSSAAAGGDLPVRDLEPDEVDLGLTVEHPDLRLSEQLAERGGSGDEWGDRGLRREDDEGLADRWGASLRLDPGQEESVAPDARIT